MAPQLHFEAQQEARQRQQTTEFKEACQLRAGVEGTILQVVYVIALDNHVTEAPQNASTEFGDCCRCESFSGSCLA